MKGRSRFVSGFGLVFSLALLFLNAFKFFNDAKSLKILDALKNHANAPILEKYVKPCGMFWKI